MTVYDGKLWNIIIEFIAIMQRLIDKFTIFLTDAFSKQRN